MLLRSRQTSNNDFTPYIDLKNPYYQYFDKYPQISLKYDIHWFLKNCCKKLYIFEILQHFCIIFDSKVESRKKVLKISTKLTKSFNIYNLLVHIFITYTTQQKYSSKLAIK